MVGMCCYLSFEGNCREAMEFYAKGLEAELEVRLFGEMPGGGPPESASRVMHARITKGPMVLMASDSMPGTPLTFGNNFSISVMPADRAETDRYFNALSEGGNVRMGLQDTFWGAYFGMFTDRYGINWMINCEGAAQA